MVHPLINQAAPAITLPDSDGKDFTIEPGKSGQPMALFFYPASGTYGCTKEACTFRDAIKANEVFKRSKCEVIGISGDAVQKQKSFSDEHGLGYPILSDANGEARKLYKVSKGLMGMSEGRVTFFVDPSGKVMDVYDSVINFNQHSKFVTRCLEKLEKQAPKPTPTQTSTADPAAPATATL